MEPPEAIEATRRDADWHLVLEVESISREERSTTGGVHRCRAQGIVRKVLRAPAVHAAATSELPQVGRPFTVLLACWHSLDPGPEPPGPARVLHGPGIALPVLEIWGSLQEGALRVASFTELDRPPPQLEGGSDPVEGS